MLLLSAALKRPSISKKHSPGYISNNLSHLNNKLYFGVRAIEINQRSRTSHGKKLLEKPRMKKIVITQKYQKNQKT